MTRGRLNDGQTANPHTVEVRASAGALRLRFDDGREERIEAATLIRADSPTGSLRIGRNDIPGWRLTLAEPVDDAILSLLPPATKGYGRWVDRIGLVPALVGFGALAGMILFVGHAAPAAVAPYIPERWERDLGSAMIGDFGDNRCTRREGNRALAAMVERVAPGATRGENGIRLTAVNYSIFNAAALPGRRIVVFKEMLTDTRADDSLAGVMAHEVAHIRRRHVTQALVRELGIGSLIRLFAGGIGANVEQLVALSYTRKNEEEADADAIAMLKAANVDPRPTARLFARLAKMEGDSDKGGYSAEFLNSHPISRDRARAFAASYDKARRYTPSLTPEQADELVDVCWTKSKAS